MKAFSTKHPIRPTLPLNIYAACCLVYERVCRLLELLLMPKSSTTPYRCCMRHSVFRFSSFASFFISNANEIFSQLVILLLAFPKRTDKSRFFRRNETNKQTSAAKQSNNIFGLTQIYQIHIIGAYLFSGPGSEETNKFIWKGCFFCTLVRWKWKHYIFNFWCNSMWKKKREIYTRTSFHMIKHLTPKFIEWKNRRK